MILPENRTGSKLELHYFFSDDSHSMNALARNKCEHELLCIINEVSFLLGTQVHLEAEALKEGGLRELWNITGENSNQITVILLLLTLLVTFIPEGNDELEELQIQETQLSIEEKKINIEKLKKELRQNIPLKGLDHEGVISDLNSQLKIITHKSNFYSQLIETKKITKIHTVALDINDSPLDDGKTVERKHFHKFLLTTDNLKSETDEQAEIEIISPVLKKGNFKWKGIYQGEVITFYMKDKEFKNDVIAGNIPFKNGDFLECVIEKARKVDSLGEVRIVGYSVTIVVKKIDEKEIVKTPQGKRYWRTQENKKKQGNLFTHIEDNEK
jgi:hypothetical protein